MLYPNIKLVAFDFDDTVYIHPRHNYSKEEDLFLFTKIVVRDNEVYPSERFNPVMLDFMKSCYAEGISIALCSRCSLAKEADYKIFTVEALTGINIENLCVGDNSLKPVALQAYADAYRIDPGNILFVDDLWDNLVAVENAGFKTASPSEIMMFMMKHPVTPTSKQSVKPVTMSNT